MNPEWKEPVFFLVINVQDSFWFKSYKPFITTGKSKPACEGDQTSGNIIINFSRTNILNRR